MIMLMTYSFIIIKLRKSIKSFPYLSVQSRLARSRKKVIQMLILLLITELVCWAPWEFQIVFDFVYYKQRWPEIVSLICWIIGNHFLKYDIFLNVKIKDYNNWVKNVQKTLYDVKYFFMFTHSALNPLIYGYGNENMRKAFKITFPFLFKEKVFSFSPE